MLQANRSVIAKSLATLVGAGLLIAAQTGAAQTVTAVPASIKTQYNITSPWYTKYVDAWGVPVLGSANVSDAALLEARANMQNTLRTYPYWPVPELQAKKVRVVIVARGEKMSSIPEVSAMFGTSLDTRYWGGFGATTSLPITAGTEANLIDNYGSENVFVHEFGHTIMDMAISIIDPNFNAELTAAYNNAKSKNLWANTYAISVRSEYWAEGVQSYFSVNYNGPTGGDGVHNQVNTRSELQAYDPMLYTLLNRVYQGQTLVN